MKARRDLKWKLIFFVWKFGCNHFPVHTFCFFGWFFSCLGNFSLFRDCCCRISETLLRFFFLTRCIYLTRIWWKRNAKDIKLVCHYCQPLFSHIICQTFFPDNLNKIFEVHEVHRKFFDPHFIRFTIEKINVLFL